jgi:hypothetical protein
MPRQESNAQIVPFSITAYLVEFTRDGQPVAIAASARADTF